MTKDKPYILIPCEISKGEVGNERAVKIVVGSRYWELWVDKEDLDFERGMLKAAVHTHADGRTCTTLPGKIFYIHQEGSLNV